MPNQWNNDYSDERKLELLEKFKKYVDETEMPIIAEFAYKNDVNEDTIRKWKERAENNETESVNSLWASVYKKSLAKQKVCIVRMGFKSSQQTTMSIFILKAFHGCSDQGEAKAPEIHIHNHEKEAVQKLPEAELSTLIQQGLLKPPKPAKKTARN